MQIVIPREVPVKLDRVWRDQLEMVSVGAGGRTLDLHIPEEALLGVIVYTRLASPIPSGYDILGLLVIFEDGQTVAYEFFFTGKFSGCKLDMVPKDDDEIARIFETFGAPIPPTLRRGVQSADPPGGHCSDCGADLSDPWEALLHDNPPHVDRALSYGVLFRRNQLVPKA